MNEIIQLKKYQHAMQQIGELFNALFTRSAELEMAQVRIAELEEKEKEDGRHNIHGIDELPDKSKGGDSPRATRTGRGNKRRSK